MNTKTYNGARLNELRERIRAVRMSIVEMLARIDDINLQQIPQVRREYALKIGCWEQELLAAELAGRRAKRHLALVQARVNRGEQLDYPEIEAELDEELAAWQEKADLARAAYEAMMKERLGVTTLSAADTKEFKRLYRMLVKRLHPDVCRGEDDCAELFKLAQCAYAQGDVETLRSLEVATRHLDPAIDDLETVTDEAVLEQELELALIEEGVVRERLEEVESCEEMQLAKQLADLEWVCARTGKFRRAIEEWTREKDTCERKLENLRRGVK